MYVTGPSAGQTAQSSKSNSGAENDPLSSGNLDTTFAQLLVAQLKSQDPLNPMDPTQFVTQLVGLNTLDAVTSIYQLLQRLSGETSTGSASGGH